AHHGVLSHAEDGGLESGLSLRARSDATRAGECRGLDQFRARSIEALVDRGGGNLLPAGAQALEDPVRYHGALDQSLSARARQRTIRESAGICEESSCG